MVTEHLSDDALADLAAALAEAEKTGVPIAPPSTTLRGFDLAAAYRVQRLNIARRTAAGERGVGHKVGLTSLAMQRQLGVDQPDFGVILDRMVVADGGTVDSSALIAPRVEAEFAFRLGSDVPVNPTTDDLVNAIDGIAVALEIIDSRIADWKITLVDTVADNASSARIVCGDFIDAGAAALQALPHTEIVLTRDTLEAGRGPGSAVLGHPLTSLEWLATAIGGFGDRFRAGDIVLAGAVAAAVPLRDGVRWEAAADGFPTVTLHSTRDEE